MEIIDNGNIVKIVADMDKRITDHKRTFFSKMIYVKSRDMVDNYEEVGYDIWGPHDPNYLPESTVDKIETELHYLKYGITWEEYLDSLKENSDILEAKKQFILKSKENLAIYLDEHPLKSSCHGGKEQIYTVTLEKQSMFTSKYLAHTILTQCGSTERMTWNAQGQPCEEWLDYECLQFISEMNAYVTPLVSCQQHIEVEIREAKTIDQLKKISLKIYPRKVTTNETV